MSDIFGVDMKSLDQHTLVSRDGGVARRPLSVADVEGMVAAGLFGPEERFELIDGDIYTMSPKQSRHEAVKLALNRRLSRTAPDHLLVGVETTVFLDKVSFVDPDLTLFPAKIPSGQVRAGDLLLVVEVAVSTLRYDRDIKAELYARHGVPLYWLIDAERRETWVHAAPRDGVWGLIKRVGTDEALTLDAVPGFSFRLAELD